jgi:hypothetical protein
MLIHDPDVLAPLPPPPTLLRPVFFNLVLLRAATLEKFDFLKFV